MSACFERVDTSVLQRDTPDRRIGLDTEESRFCSRFVEMTTTGSKMKSTTASLGSGFQQRAALFCAVQSGLVRGALTLAAVLSSAGISRADEGGVKIMKMKCGRIRIARYALMVLLGSTLLAALPDLCVAQPYPVPPTWGGTSRDRPRLTGDWGGVRDELGKKGVVFDADILFKSAGRHERRQAHRLGLLGQR